MTPIPLGLRGVWTGPAVLLLLALPGCGPLQRRHLPDPFPVQPPYGEIVREIRIVGNKTTDEDVIRESLETRLGRPYSRDDANRDYDRLTQLGVFTSISFDTEPADGGIALTVHVGEVSTYLPTLSFALTQENGMEIGPGFSSPNLLGRAAKASAYVRFGGAKNGGLRFRDTWHPTGKWHRCCFEIEFYHRERHNELDDFQELSNEGMVQYLYNLTTGVHVGARVSYLSVSAQEDSAGVVPGVTLNPAGKDVIPGLGLVVEYDSRNLISYPTTGWFVQISAMQYGGDLGGYSDYPRVELDMRRYLQLAGPRHALAAYSLLTLTGGTMGKDVPIHQDFHLGGTNSVRGWPLGSRSGKDQWINTVEYWWTLVPESAYKLYFLKWSMGLQLAAFADVATAWDSREEFNPNWIGGGGLGARLTMSQMGFLRFDMAMGKIHPGVRISFHVGGSERAIAQKRRVR
ncbi:MAG: BamA/TamA family outer membrane protein [Gemmatimonadota bacterium]|jgi:outer membrane protein assembly factor BamA